MVRAKLARIGLDAPDGNGISGMKKSILFGVGLMIFALAGCSGTTNQQLQMSGSDRNYPHSGVFSGEDGRGLIYSSEWKRQKEGEATDPNTAGMSDEEKKAYSEWKADKDQADFEAWKQARVEQTGAQADTVPQPGSQ